ncbi:MAG: MFS transporter [Rubrimonas sp.]
MVKQGAGSGPGGVGQSGAPLRAVAMLALGQTLSWAALYYSFAGLVLVWERDLGWSKDALALGLTVAVFVSAAVAPFAGRAIDAGHGAALMGGGALLGAGALAALSQAATQGGFVAAWAAIGAAQGCCLYEACFACVTRAMGAQARPAITRITLAAGFASTLAFPGFALAAEAFGWRGATLWAAAITASITAPLLWAGARALPGADARASKADPAARAEAARAGRAGMRRALRRPAFWLLAAAFPMLALNHGMLINHLLPLLDARGLSPSLAILAASLIGPMQVAGRLAMMATERRIAAPGLALAGYLALAGAALALLAAGAAPGLVFVFVAAQGAAIGVMSVLKPVVIADLLGHSGYGAIAGWLASPYLVGFAVAPSLGAALWRIGGYDLAIAAACALALLGALALWGALRWRDR